MNSIEAAKRNQVAAEVTADARKNVAVRRAEADAEAKALQGEGISRQRQAIVQGLKDSVGLVDPDEVSELLLITQYVREGGGAGPSGKWYLVSQQ